MGDLWPRLLAAFKRPLVWWIVVAEWEQGVRVRLGKTSTSLGPGIHLRIPFLDRVYVQSVRLRTIEDSGTTATTKDGKTVTISFALSFSIVSMIDFYRSMASPEQTLTTRVSASIVEAVAQLESSEVSQASIQGAASVGDTDAFGLSEIDIQITAVAVCRTYRVLSRAYRSGVGLGDLDGAGER